MRTYSLEWEYGNRDSNFLDTHDGLGSNLIGWIPGAGSHIPDSVGIKPMVGLTVDETIEIDTFRNPHESYMYHSSQVDAFLDHWGLRKMGLKDREQAEQWVKWWTPGYDDEFNPTEPKELLEGGTQSTLKEWQERIEQELDSRPYPT